MKPNISIRALTPVLASILVIVGVALSACGGTPSEDGANGDPAKVEPINGSDIAQVTLTARAAERIGLKTGVIRRGSEKNSQGHIVTTQGNVVPYGAILYDADGGTWVYTSPAPLEFVRARVKINYIDNSDAVLSTGPPLGTTVVTVGASELYGTEFGVEE